jgi:cyclopropane fatty-acyl-phospholipid synthase-like methyltransferase
LAAVTDGDDGTSQYEPAAHYDRITDPWKLLLGEELHYGVFETGSEALPVATAALTARMVEGAQLAPGLRVLDVGCGTGAPACQLVEDHGVEVLGITPSTVGVERARARAAERGLAGATFESRDGTDNGLPDASFDRVWVLESSHLMRERDRLMTECARVLRPGGRLVLCDLVRHRVIPFKEVKERREDFAVLRAAFGDAHMESLEYYEGAATANGLVVDRLDDLTERTLPTFDRWRANARDHRAEVLELMSQEDLDAFERSTDILEGFWRDGTFGYGLIAAQKP